MDLDSSDKLALSNIVATFLIFVIGSVWTVFACWKSTKDSVSAHRKEQDRNTLKEIHAFRKTHFAFMNFLYQKEMIIDQKQQTQQNQEQQPFQKSFKIENAAQDLFDLKNEFQRCVALRLRVDSFVDDCTFLLDNENGTFNHKMVLSYLKDYFFQISYWDSKMDFPFKAYMNLDLQKKAGYNLFYEKYIQQFNLKQDGHISDYQGGMWEASNEDEERLRKKYMKNSDQKVELEDN